MKPKHNHEMEWWTVQIRWVMKLLQITRCKLHSPFVHWLNPYDFVVPVVAQVAHDQVVIPEVQDGDTKVDIVMDVNP